MKNSIKILGLVILFFIGFTNVNAQKCISEKNPITGEFVKKTDEFVIVLHQAQSKITATFNKVSEKYYIDVKILLDNYSGKVLTSDDEYIIKLADGKIITLKTKENVIPAAMAFGWSSYECRFYLSEEELKNMQNSALAFLRFSISGKAFDETISAKNGKKWLKAAKCILE